jgi:DNA-binding transcriptional MerR regulator
MCFPALQMLPRPRLMVRVESTGGPAPDPGTRGARNAFSIGEAAAIVGVSTHVLRSWERRLSLGINHRTSTNQRRYWIEDIQRFIAIRQLHENGGLPLVESAAHAMRLEEPPPRDTPRYEATAVNAFWAGLIDTLGDLLLVIDETGRIRAANEVARAQLNVRQGSSFARLAPIGWRQAYHSIHRATRAHARSDVLAMRARSGVIFVDACLVPVGRRPDGPAVMIGKQVSEDQAGQDMAGRTRPLDG